MARHDVAICSGMHEIVICSNANSTGAVFRPYALMYCTVCAPPTLPCTATLQSQDGRCKVHHPSDWFSRDIRHDLNLAGLASYDRVGLAST